MKKLYVALIPDVETIDLIWELRKKVVEMGWGEDDPRGKILPHCCISYLKEGEEISEEMKVGMIARLDEADWGEKIALAVERCDTISEGKLAVFFDADDMRELVAKAERAVGQLAVVGNQKYVEKFGTEIGDHMKLARHIKGEHKSEVSRLFEGKVGSSVIFERVVFAGYGFEEKDILWEKQLGV